ncbi:hypothetical protein O3M35_002219 [Rhynocoris fuscipes]|uniref:Asparagine synthetase [glutamine-hydrolyzing] n=1 Tax=Rhynocoris fuscipes TaxID=488301 RepID=A0AAW1CTM9_9HEMI
MCGIWVLFGYTTESVKHCDCTFSRIRHRGPDAWRIQYDNKVTNVCIGFTRLAIVDSVYGMQPMILHAFPHLTLICNGELYNYKKLGSEFGFNYETKCDVECILQMYGAGLPIDKCVMRLDGVFAFTLIDSKRMKAYTARDPFGVRPLYRLETTSGILGLCSEGKGLVNLGTTYLNGESWTLKQFPPGYYAEYDILPSGRTKLVVEKKYYNIGDPPKFRPFIPRTEIDGLEVSAAIRKLLTEAVRKRLMSDRRIGCLLSGGLDSSLITALVVKLAKENNVPYKIQTFAIGMGSSPDLVAARKVAQHCGTEHHEVLFSEQDVGNVLDRVLRTIETCDITTVRASVGMYLIAEYIKNNTDSAVIMSGEGADELAQGYIYFRDAPNADEADKESRRLLEDIHLYDGQRADRTTAAHGLELRTPFLDLQFTHYFLSLPAEVRQPKDGVEKYILRNAFESEDLLPKSILWRHKEAFSDGVASIRKSLFQVIQEYVESRIPDEALEQAKQKYAHLTPLTKEALYYRQVFDSEFPKQAKHLTPYYWMPKWCEVNDPSARFLNTYAATADNL